MATNVGKIAAPQGTYIEGGQEKTRWGYYGAVFRNDKGQLRLKFDSIPTNMHETGGWFSVFENKPQQEPEQQGFRKRPKSESVDPNEDVPF